MESCWLMVGNEKRPDIASNGICKDMFLDNGGTFETVKLSTKRHKNMGHKLKEPQQSWRVPELPNARMLLAGKGSSTEMELWILNVAAESTPLEPPGRGTHNTLAAFLWVGG